MLEKKCPLVVSSDIHYKIKNHCARVGLSISAFVNYALAKELKSIESKREKADGK